MNEQYQESFAPIFNYNDIIIISVSPTPSFTADFGVDPSDPPPPGAGESEEQIREIQARAREPRQNSPPGSPALLESDSSSTEDSDDDVTEDLLCDICASREITVHFKGCSHASCTRCAKNIWWNKVQTPLHYPTWFSCPWCRTEITMVGMLLREAAEPGDAMVVHREVLFTVRKWETLVEWMKARSKIRMDEKAREAEITTRLL